MKVVVGDREFRSVELAYWLKQKKVYFALRQKQGNYIQRQGQDYQKLSELGLAPGMKLFLTGVNFTKKKGFGQFSLAAYWKRKYRGKSQNEGWYILTNLNTLEAAINVYQARSGIEAMFKDCKSGGYNLEDSKASVERLTNKRAFDGDCLYLCWIARSTHQVQGTAQIYMSPEGIEKNHSTPQ